MKMTRRKTLALLGGGTIVAAAGGFLGTRTPHRALAPWDNAGGYGDPRLNAISYAILAPNPHNLQPWMVELVGEDRVRIHRDPDRALPHTDPYDRQITVGFGCFLEQMAIAASTSGHALETTLFPEGAVAEVTFKTGASPDPLARQILARRSCKEPFDAQAVEQAKIEALAPFANIHTDDQTVNALRGLTFDAWLTEVGTPRTLKESVDVMRFGKAEIEATPDGIDLGGPFLESLMLAGLLTRESQSDMTSTSGQQAIRMYRDQLTSTPAYATILSAGNTRQDQIEAGRRWLRLNLKTTELGLALHPVSQCLQEYPEVADHYAQAHGLLAPDGQTVQMLGRLGYGPTVPRAPRWPLEAKRLDV